MGLFLKGKSSTTLTATLSIIPSTISEQSHCLNTENSMRQNSHRNAKSIWTQFAPLRRSGMGAKKALNGIRNMGRKYGLEESQSRYAVQNAEALLKLLSQPKMMSRDIAQAHVADVLPIEPIDTRDRQNAQCAVASSGNRSIEKNPKRAHVFVVQSYERKELADVYDIQVAEHHEFLASGVIVHNCVWGLTDLLIDSAGGGVDWIDLGE